MWLPIWRMEIKSQRQKAILIEENEMCLNWQHSKTNCGTVSAGSMRDRDRQRKTANSLGMHTMIFPSFFLLYFVYFFFKSNLCCFAVSFIHATFSRSFNYFSRQQRRRWRCRVYLNFVFSPYCHLWCRFFQRKFSFIYSYFIFFFIAPHTQVIRLNQWIMQ